MLRRRDVPQAVAICTDCQTRVQARVRGGVPGEDGMDADNADVDALLAAFVHHGLGQAGLQQQQYVQPGLGVPNVADPAAEQPGLGDAQAPARPYSLRWYFERNDQPIYPGARRTTGEAAYSALKHKLAGKVFDQAFDDLCWERWQEGPDLNSYPRHAPLHGWALSDRRGYWDTAHSVSPDVYATTIPTQRSHLHAQTWCCHTVKPTACSGCAHLQ